MFAIWFVEHLQKAAWQKKLEKKFMFAISIEEQGHMHQYFSTGADLSFVLVRGLGIKKSQAN